MPATFLQQLLARDPRKLARFPDPAIDQALTAWRALSESLAESAATPAAPAPPTDAAADLDGPLADLATHVWRARHRLQDNAQPADAVRRSGRHIDSAVEAFGQLELTLKDWLNEPYDPGLPVKVLTFQPTPGLTRDTVIEAIRPAVLWRGRLLQSGEVVVGTPLEETPDA
ncbi:MAG: hypothetical protein ABII82_12805 [Verrucomicrobiota bacterium]